jgi:hypothetical protein
MGVRLRKRIFLVVMASSLFLFVAACNEAPTAQPWERDMAAIQPVPVDNTPKPEVEESAGPKESQKTSELKPSPVTPKYVSVDKVKETAPARLEESFEMRGCTVNIDADVLVRTRDPQSCPIYQVEPFRYNLEEVVELIFGENAEEALAYDKTNPKPPELPELHRYHSGNVHVTVENSLGMLSMLNRFPSFDAADKENQKEDKDVQLLPSGVCDAISFSREEAIEKARAYVEPFNLPVDLTLPRVKALQWHDFQYYEIVFEQLYGGIPVYPNNSFATSFERYVNVNRVSVQVCEEGISSIDSYLSRQKGIEAEYRQVIDFDTAYGLFKEYLYDKLIQTPMMEIRIEEVEFAYFPVLPKDYDGSYWLMAPCWIFLDEIYDCAIVILGPDGSLVQI